jgi:hypothetical protein
MTDCLPWNAWDPFRQLQYLTSPEKLSDQTVRRHWEQARKVNIAGERVAIDPDGPLAEAQWAKHRVGLATQALPNGYCGLPLQKTCPHANACGTQSWSFVPAAWSTPAERGSIAGPDLRRDTVAAPANPGRMSRGFGRGARIVCR